MAQVLWNHLAGGSWQAESAGSKPAGYVHPLAIRALQELELPAEGLDSKHIDAFDGQHFDLVVTVCDNAQESCPVFPNSTEVLHWPFDDPADATGTDDEKFPVFVRVRDQIKNRISEYLG